MVSSTLNPQAITKSRPATPDSFGSFMTGKSSLGNSSSLTEASNKIVKFSNPTVSTVPLDISSLLTNISTNILNQVDNSIQNTTNFIKTDINRDFETQLNNLRSDIYSKLDGIQDNTKYLQKDVIKTTNEIYQQILNQSPTKIQKQILEKLVPQLETRILEITNNTNQKQILEKIVPQLENRILEITNNTNQKQILEKIVPQLENRILELTNNTNTNQSQVKSETSVSQIQQTIINIQEQAKNVVDNTLKSFSQDYQQKIKGFDDNRPNNVLSKFLDLYQNAIGFVNFFGDRKNINTVEKNLKSLRVMFEESFEVAKVLRQTIVKIVKQLSNLPSASPSAGGLNLDVNVPGGRLKQAGGPSVRNVGRGAGLGAAAGIGLLGLGGVAAAASGMGKAKQYQEEMLASGVEGAPMGQSIPEGFVDAFSSIVDRFTSAIEGLVKGAKSSPGSSGGGGGGGGPSPSPSSSGGGGGGGSTSMEGTTGPQGKATNALLDTIAFAEGTSNKPNKGYNTHFGGSQTQDLSKHPDKVIHTPRYSSAAFGRYQFMPNTWGSVGGGAMTPDRQDAGAVRLTIKRLNAAGIAVKDATELETLLQKEGMSPRISAALSPEWASFPTLSGNSFYGQPVKKLSDMQDVYKKQLGSQPTTTTAATPTTPGGVVAAAPAQTQMQTRAQAISQPAQKVPQTISLSPTIIDASPPQQDQQQSGGVSAPPPSGGGSIEVPMLPTTNPDNFLTMYSRIVYNIVDG
jgi:muramidase (phage lysozyme)